MTFHRSHRPRGAVERAVSDHVSWRRDRQGEQGANARCVSPAEVLELVCSRPARVDDLVVLAQIAPESLPSKALQLDYSRRVDEATSCAASLQVRATTALAGAEPTGDYLAEVHVETEVALARSISPTAAGLEIETARVLSSTFPDFLEALAVGRISVAHCRRLAEATRPVVDAAAQQAIGRRALPLAMRLTPGRFAQRLAALVAEHDPDAAARLARATADSRDCSVKRLPDGLGRLVYVDEWTKVSAVGNRIRRAGRATQRARRSATGGPRASQHHSGDAGAAGTVESAAGAATHDRLDEATDAGSCRADALLAIVLGAEQADGSVVLDPADVVRVECQVVVDLETLRGEADHVALLDGMPVPAEVGRQWAGSATVFRRMVTDPVTGHLLDKGRAYTADDVREFVLHRDGGCRIPVCGVRHRDRLEVDHAQGWPAGPTSAANLGALDTTHHQLKTRGYLDLADSRADGSVVLTTRWGQRIVVPPRAFLHEPDPPPPGPAPPAEPRPSVDDDPPPF